MRKIREVLRLRFERHLPQRAIGQSLRLSQGAVNAYLSRARRAGLSWPLADDLDDVRLEALLVSAARRTWYWTGARCRTGRRCTAIYGGRM